MALSTFTELKAAIADYLERDDLSDQIDNWIALAEARHQREVRIREMLVRAKATTGTDRYLALPVGFLQMSMFRLLTDPVTVLEELNMDGMTRRRRERTDRPRFFTVHEEIEFDVIPTGDFVVEMIYYKKLTPLSAQNETNALLTLASDAYLYAALSASSPYLEDDQVQTWEHMYGIARDGLIKTDRRARFSTPVSSQLTQLVP